MRLTNLQALWSTTIPPSHAEEKLITAPDYGLENEMTSRMFFFLSLKMNLSLLSSRIGGEYLFSFASPDPV